MKEKPFESRRVLTHPLIKTISAEDSDFRSADILERFMMPLSSYKRKMLFARHASTMSSGHMLACISPIWDFRS